MNKIIITAIVAAVALGSFAQGIPQPKSVHEADALDIMGTILFQAVPGLRRGIVL